MDVTVNGKRVTLKDKLSAREGWPVVMISNKVAMEKTIAFDDEVTVMTIVVDSWEFEGDPHDRKSYENLDLWEEFTPLSNEVAVHVYAIRTTQKNSTKPPISDSSSEQN